MSTQYYDRPENEGGRLLAVRCSGSVAGVPRLLLRLQVDSETWATHETVISETGHRVHRADLEQQCTVVAWTRLQARATACEYDRLARRWATHPRIAYACTAAAQRIRSEHRV